MLPAVRAPQKPAIQARLSGSQYDHIDWSMLYHLSLPPNRIVYIPLSSLRMGVGVLASFACPNNPGFTLS